MTGDAWEILRNYESHELVQRRLEKVHSTRIHAGKAKDVAAAFLQARAYFDSASSADYTIKPLLLYYGLLGLSRGIILFLHPGKRESDLQGSHGLFVKGWHATPPTNGEIASLKIGVSQNGTFPEFVAATKNRTLIRKVVSTLVVRVWQHQQPNNEFYVSFHDLLSRIPDLQYQYLRLGGIRRSCRVDFDHRSEDKENFIAYVYKHDLGAPTDPSLEHRLFGQLPDGAIRDQGARIQIVASREDKNWPSVWDLHRGPQHTALDGPATYVVERMPNQLDLSKSATAFLCSYTLGMLARYFPLRWTSLIRGANGDAIMPTLHSAMNFIEHRFPEMASDFLEYAHSVGPPEDGP